MVWAVTCDAVLAAQPPIAKPSSLSGVTTSTSIFGIRGFLRVPMFFLKKIVTYLILPPGIFILVLMGTGLYLLKRHRKIGYVVVFSGACLYALSIGPVKDALISPLESSFPVQANLNGDVIVILGSGTESEALSRFMCGHRLWKRLHVPVILTGSGEKGYEKRLLMEMGVAE